MKEEGQLPKETIDNIEAEAEKIYPIDETYLPEGATKQYLKRQAYCKAALHCSQIIEQKDKEIEKAHKFCNHLEENWTCQKSINQIEQLKAENERLTAERDAYKEMLNDVRDNIWYVPSEAFVKKITEVLNQFNNTENKKP